MNKATTTQSDFENFKNDLAFGGWKHRMMGSLRGQSNCWVFCKALRVFPPLMWTINIVKASIVNVHMYITLLVRNNNAIYPSGFNLRYNQLQCCSVEKHPNNHCSSSVEKLNKYMQKENVIYPGGFNLWYNVGERGNLYKLVKYMREFIAS